MGAGAGRPEPILRASRFGFSAEVFPAYVRLTNGTWLKKRTTIPLRQIATVERDRAPGYVTLTTSGGQAHRFLIGAAAQEFVDAVVTAMHPETQAPESEG